MRNVRISPSILSADFGRLGGVVKELEESGADSIHLDVMDGRFVRNITFGPPVVRSIREYTGLPLKAHLMIESPTAYVDQFIDSGADAIIIHAESTGDKAAVLEHISGRGMGAGIAINPETPLASVAPYLQKADTLLVMSVNPGFGGQRFIPGTMAKIMEARRLIDKCGFKATISVDGGVNVQNAGEIRSAGADELVAGSAVIGSDDMKETIARLRA